MDAAHADGIEMEINDRHRAEIIPLVPAADAVNKSFDRVRHVGPRSSNLPHRLVSCAAPQSQIARIRIHAASAYLRHQFFKHCSAHVGF